METKETYEWLDKAYMERAIVCQHGYYGVIDINTNKLVVPIEYDYIHLFNSGIALVRKDTTDDNAVPTSENFGLINFITGSIVEPVIYTNTTELYVILKKYPTID